MMPGNPAFGATVLRLPAEQSPNFVTGVSGWFIGQDGSAEFNDVTIRGGEVIDGTTLIYDGTPAAGNLIESVSPVATTDQFGNTVFQGTTNIKLSAGTYYAVNTGINNTLSFLTAASEAGPWTNNGGIGQGANSLSAITTAFAVTGSMSVNGAVTATGGTSADPTVISTDTWHNVTPPTGFSGLLRYRMRAEDDVEVEAQMAVGTTAGTGVITLITLPAAYTPASTQRGSCGVFTNGIPSSGAGVQGILNLRWSADPAGTFTLRAFPGGAANTGITECSFNIRYALD